MIKRLVVSKENLLKYYGKTIPRLDYRLRYDSCAWINAEENQFRGVNHLHLRPAAGLDVDFNRYSTNLQAYQVLRIFEGSSQDLLILPKDIVESLEIPGTLEVFSKVLDSMFPGRYWLRDRGNEYIELYLLFPELEIQNTPGGKHKIRNLVVKVPLRDDCSLAAAVLYGVRATMTKAELAVNYQHSHLGSASSNMTDFCTGGGSRFTTYLNHCTKKSLSESEFELFLVQLEQYLKWESLEGSPHRMISTIAAGSNSAPRLTESQTIISRTARLILLKLTPDLLHKKGVAYTVNPGLNEAKWLELETAMIAGGCAAHDYSVNRMQWVNVALDPSGHRLPRFWESTEGRQVQLALKLSPGIVSGDTVVGDNSIIKRVSPETFSRVLIELMSLLNKHTKVTNNEQSDVNR